MKNNKGFTLVEVLIAAGIMLLALSGLLVTYVYCFLLNETTRNTTLALSAARAKMEELKQETFDDLLIHNNEVFNIDGFVAGRAIGRVEVANVATYTDLRQIRIIVCWRQLRNRIIGEDANLSGSLDAGEDTNNNARLDSPVEVISFVSG